MTDGSRVRVDLIVISSLKNTHTNDKYAFISNFILAMLLNYYVHKTVDVTSFCAFVKTAVTLDLYIKKNLTHLLPSYILACNYNLEQWAKPQTIQQKSQTKKFSSISYCKSFSMLEKKSVATQDKRNLVWEVQISMFFLDCFYLFLLRTDNF